MARRLDIRIKRVYDAPEDADGTRVLVDRVWPRGVSKESAHLALWLKDVAPSPELRRWFGHTPERWEEFRRRYRAELERNDEAVARLRELARQGRVTLVYGARDTEHNQAVVLAEHLGGARPSAAAAGKASPRRARRESRPRLDVKPR